MDAILLRFRLEQQRIPTATGQVLPPGPASGLQFSPALCAKGLQASSGLPVFLPCGLTGRAGEELCGCELAGGAGPRAGRQRLLFAGPGVVSGAGGGAGDIVGESAKLARA